MYSKLRCPVCQRFFFLVCSFFFSLPILFDLPVPAYRRHLFRGKRGNETVGGYRGVKGNSSSTLPFTKWNKPLVHRIRKYTCRRLDYLTIRLLSQLFLWAVMRSEALSQISAHRNWEQVVHCLSRNQLLVQPYYLPDHINKEIPPIEFFENRLFFWSADR